jgi:hypothetical protein
VETTTNRQLSCPQCGEMALAVLYWDPQTAWKARVHRLRCPNRCAVATDVVLAVLGLAR